MTNELSATDYEIPCDHIPCEEPHEVDLASVLLKASKTSYYTDLWVGPNDQFIFPAQIYKCRSVRMAAGGKVKFNLQEPHSWYAFVIEELQVDISDSDDYDMTWEWWGQTLSDLESSLRGANGLNAPHRPIAKKGVSGLPGGTGYKGGTRHSPHIFIFIRRVVGKTRDLENTSFKFDMKGVAGGTGGTGGRGGNADEGKRGSDGKLGGVFTACSTGKTGKSGGAPGKGGRGGDGGCGGAGPEVFIYYGDQALRDIFERSKYNLNGADAPTGNDGPARGGQPGEAGNPGRGGKGGRRAGNCGSGSRGAEGLPSVGTYAWKRWDRGYGLPGTAGRDGDYDLTPIEPDSIEDSVFEDPIS